MKSNRRRIRPSVFLHSARMVFAVMKNRGFYFDFYIPDMKIDGRYVSPSKFCCDNLNQFNRNFNTYENRDLEYEYFGAVFEKDSGRSECLGWWPNLENGSHDYESRIIALLLCYEMSKDGVKFD
jgi:hypothetical protein